MLLEGVKVLECTLAWAGPLAGRYLADLGAEVIYLEHRSTRGFGHHGIGGELAADEVADWKWGEAPGPVFSSGIYPDADPGEHPWNRQGLFNKLARNKRSLCVDVKTAEGRAILIALIERCDVMLDNFSPRGVQSMGIDYESVKPHNPDIIRVSLSGYGHTGPDHMRWSLGPILEAHSGLAWTTGYPDDGPLKLGIALPDPIGGMHAAAAVIGALEAREQTGQGGFIDISQYETYASIGGEFYLESSLSGAAPPRLGNRSEERAPQGVYPASGEEEWLAISVEDDGEWQALVEVIGGRLSDFRCLGLEQRQRNHDEIDAAIALWSSTRDRFEAMAELQRAGIRASALMTNQDAVEGDQMTARGFVVEWDQVDVGRRGFPGFPIHFDEPAEIPMRGAPGLGEDNGYVLEELLGYPPEKVRELTASEVLATTPT